MKKILIIAGEASGDLHGANLVREVRKQIGDIAVTGVGSRNMREAGVTMLADASEISVVGATEVLTHVGAIYRVFSLLRRFLREERPDLVVLIDFPDFNLLVGSAARRLGIPVLYYISPQVWAWRRGRARKIARLVRAIMVLFPFEVEIYRKEGADVRFVGHPLADVASSAFSRDEARSQFGLALNRPVVALLPGSRAKEIEYLLPDMLGAARLLRNRFPVLQFVLPVAPTLDPTFVGRHVAAGNVPVTMVDGRAYDALRASDAAIVTSGTATLETGLMAVPMVIVYRVSRLSYLIGRAIVKVKNIGLVNIVAGRTIVPELVQDDVTPENIAREIETVLADPRRHHRVVQDLLTVRTMLGEGGASRKAAAVIREFLGVPA
jgi:lipid-A-disaccharide synthase